MTDKLDDYRCAERRLPKAYRGRCRVVECRPRWIEGRQGSCLGRKGGHLSQYKELPLSSLAELQEKVPTIYLRLNARGERANAAEEEFLRQMLP
jgi:hypothetical protein